MINPSANSFSNENSLSWYQSINQSSRQTKQREEKIITSTLTDTNIHRSTSSHHCLSDDRIPEPESALPSPRHLHNILPSPHLITTYPRAPDLPPPSFFPKSPQRRPQTASSTPAYRARVPHPPPQDQDTRRNSPHQPPPPTLAQSAPFPSSSTGHPNPRR
jgi:hypothetical protein